MDDTARDDQDVEAETVAREVLSRFLSREPDRLERLGGGQTNEVYAAASGAESLVVRLGREEGKAATFTHEAEVTARVRQAGVPAPEVLAVREQDGFAVMIARALPGEIGRDHPERLRTLRDLGAMAAQRIHTIRTIGFGCDFTFEAPNGEADWRVWLIGEFRAQERIDVLAAYGLISSQHQDQLEAVLAEVEEWDDPPILHHGDLRLKNVLVDDDGAILGLLDWEQSLSAPRPHWDLSVALHDLWVDQVQAFLEGYGMNPAEAEEAAPTWRLFNALNYVPEAERAIDAGDEKALEAIRLRFSGALDLFGRS